MIPEAPSRWKALAWNLFGQGGAALLGLALIKVSVSAFPISAYGTAALLLGLQALVRNTTLNPLLNLAIYTSREEEARFGAGWIHAATGRALGTLVGAALPLFLLAIWALRIPVERTLLAVGWLLVLLASEAFKTARLNLLHCDGQASRFALWTLADAALKPAMILGFLATGQERGALSLLACHALGSTLSLALTLLDAPLQRLARAQRKDSPPHPTPGAWVSSHRTFLLPLVGVGLTGWITGLSDRYLVNLYLGAESAGLYAGIYALFSSPFLILGTAFTLAIRPRLLALQAEGRAAERDRWFRQGLAGLALGAFVLAAILYLARGPLVTALLRPDYLQALPAAPGILLGNAILALGTSLEQAFFVTHRTHLVLAKQVAGSLTAILVVLWMAPRFGLEGVGWACPIYAAVELMSGMLILGKSRKSRPLLPMA